MTTQKKNCLQYPPLQILGDFGNCNSTNLCGEDEGDCDYDNQCKEAHKCGTDNCRNFLGFPYQYDCCYSEEEDFCTLENPCTENQGDCDSNSDCLNELVCGFDNCPHSIDYDTKVDCCYNASIGSYDYCTTYNPCGVNEGDCDSDNECQTNHFCDITNSCPAYLGFASDVNCCVGRCKSH